MRPTLWWAGQSVNHIFAMHNMQRTNQRAAARKANFHSILIGAKQAIDVEEMESERQGVGAREREEATRFTPPSFMLVSAYCKHYWKAAGIKMHIKCRINYKFLPPPSPPYPHTPVVARGVVSAG